MKKKLMLLLSLVLCMIFVVGCKNNKDSKEKAVELTKEVHDLVVSNTDQNFDMWVEFNFADVYNNPSVDKDTQNEYRAWGNLRKGLGKLESKTEVKVGKVVFDEETNQYTVTTKMTGNFAKGKIDFSMRFDQNGNFVQDSLKVNEIQTRSQIMSKAGLNTLMGMGTVFVVLILISLVISCFGLISKSQAKNAAKAKEQEQVLAPVVEAPVEEYEDATDDLELVAVITAAIMASMGDEAPAEGLVVRSIKKRNASKWKNA